MWDEVGVMEASEAARKHPDAIFGSTFNVMGLQNYAYPEEQHVYKIRIVFEGDK